MRFPPLGGRELGRKVERVGRRCFVLIRCLVQALQLLEGICLEGEGPFFLFPIADRRRGNADLACHRSHTEAAVFAQCAQLGGGWLKSAGRVGLAWRVRLGRHGPSRTTGGCWRSIGWGFVFQIDAEHVESASACKLRRRRDVLPVVMSLTAESIAISS